MTPENNSNHSSNCYGAEPQLSMGTAVGDLYSEQLGLGYLNTGIIVTVIIACIFLAWKFLKIDVILAFWTVPVPWEHHWEIFYPN